jgi:hypothetical protein
LLEDASAEFARKPACRAVILAGPDVCYWPILLQKDFDHPSAQD